MRKKLSPQERINNDLAAAVFGEAYEHPEYGPRTAEAAAADHLDAYAGTYEAFVPFHIITENERLFISIFGFKLELFPVAARKDGDAFEAKAAYVRIVFKKDAEGKVAEAALSWLGENECTAPKKYNG